MAAVPDADPAGSTGARGRRTQGERSANSRTLILDAALRELYENGYSHATTVTIQRRAGVSRGRLLHHFPNRDELLIAAAHHLAVEQVAGMERWVANSEYGLIAGGERSDRAVDLLWETFRQPYFWAAMELWTVARTSSDLRAELLPEERRLGTALTHVVATMFGPVHSSHPGFDDCRELLFTSMRGVALTYAVNPRDPTSDPHLPLWKQLARRMLDVRD